MIVAHANHLVSKGHEVCITAALFDTVFVLDQRIKLNRLPSQGKYFTVLTALRSKFDADFVIADIISVACLLFNRNRRKVIYFAQDNDESYYTSIIAKLFIRLLYRIGFRLLRINTIAVSGHLADIFKRCFNAQVTVVENGVNRDKFYHDPDQDLIRKKEWRLSLLLFSRSDMRKGFDMVIKVINSLRSSSRSLEIWTVGEPCNFIFGQHALRDFGYVGEDGLRKIMSSADIFLYPTRHEGFGLMPLEAMSCNCPVVTTTAVPYAVHKENAMVAEIEDCEMLSAHIMELLENENLLMSLSKAGVLFAGKRSLDDATQQFEMTLAGMMTR